MNYSESSPQSGEFLRLPLGFLAKHNLSAIPVNYTVWYEYASGKNPKLKQAIDRRLENTLPLNNKQIKTRRPKKWTQPNCLSRLSTATNGLLF